MPKAWSDKRERQYEHIKDSEKARGVGTERAEEIAARTVNKERAQHGEAKTSGGKPAAKKSAAKSTSKSASKSTSKSKR